MRTLVLCLLLHTASAIADTQLPDILDELRESRKRVNQALQESVIVDTGAKPQSSTAATGTAQKATPSPQSPARNTTPVNSAPISRKAPALQTLNVKLPNSSPARQTELNGAPTPPVTAPQPIAIATSTKLDNNGLALQADAERWSCVQLADSGLIWEVKTDDAGLRDKHHLYTWSRHAGETGVDGKCSGDIHCDTAAYVDAVNAEALCGYRDWRLPAKAELESLLDLQSPTPSLTINAALFPHTSAGWYWTATENSTHDNHAWYVLFTSGRSLSDHKTHAKHVRLVRGSLHTPPFASIDQQ